MNIGIDGALSASYGINLLEIFAECENIEPHLIISRWAEKTATIKTSYAVDYVLSLATCWYKGDDLVASILSGSFQPAGMVIVPASMKTAEALVSGFTYNLIVRSADVRIKELQQLILAPGETPLNATHLENMLKLVHLGVSILPSITGFYTIPETVHEIIDHTVGKILDVFKIENNLNRRWEGYGEA